MKKVIKSFKKLSASIQSDLYADYSEGELERTVFPYNGNMEEGVLFQTEDCIYLVPISSIVEAKFGGGDDLEDEDGDTEKEFSDEEISDEE